MTNDLKFIYFTDFHGSEKRYEKVLRLAAEKGVRLLVTSGDLLPHQNEKQFLTGWLKRWLQECRSAGAAVFGMFGNDDYAYLLPYLDEYEQRGLFRRIDSRLVEYQGWSFWGYNFVPELPFGLKDWVKLDYPGAIRPLQFSEPILVTEKGYTAIKDIDAFFRARGTIEEELAGVKFADPARTIAVIHSPPQGVGLDVTQDRRQVGSKSVLGFLLETQPALSLHGHIHESPIMTGLWKVHIGATTACQPGQTPVLVELKPGRVKLTLL